ncbi:hypothetical protein BC941DRAFT_416568 [Chlamydoabsidia padenii]|nr:hypothetical protein BC941DRAFT_416568 [Chlamydoabsidia padenii]
MPFPLLHTKKKRQSKNSCNTHSAPSSSFTSLPNEIISRIFAFLPTPDLLPLYTIPSVIINSIASNEIVTRLDQHQLGIRLYFDQETRWRYTLDMKLSPSSIQNNKGRLCFIPMTTTKNPPSYLFYTSKLIRRPTLYKVSLIATNEDLSCLPDNLLVTSHTLDIKQQGSSCSQQQDSLLGYCVTTNSTQVIKSRPGERWILPCRFECDLGWLCQTKSGLGKWLDKLHGKPIRRRMTNIHSTSAVKLPVMDGQVAELGITAPISLGKQFDTLTLIPNIFS